MKITILRQKQVSERTGISRSSIYDKINPLSPRHDPSFPRQVQLGPASVGWRESEIDAWIETRVSTKQAENTHPAVASISPPARTLNPSKTVKNELTVSLDDEHIVKVRQILEKNAKRGSCISYAEVMTPIRLQPDDSADRELMDRILTNITKTSHAENIGLLGIVVFEKVAAKGLPSEAFFDLAKSLGYTYTNPHQFVRSQIIRLYEAFEDPKNKKGKLRWVQTSKQTFLMRYI